MITLSEDEALEFLKFKKARTGTGLPANSDLVEKAPVTQRERTNPPAKEGGRKKGRPKRSIHPVSTRVLMIPDYVDICYRAAAAQNRSYSSWDADLLIRAAAKQLKERGIDTDSLGVADYIMGYQGEGG